MLTKFTKVTLQVIQAYKLKSTKVKCKQLYMFQNILVASNLELKLVNTRYKFVLQAQISKFNTCVIIIKELFDFDVYIVAFEPLSSLLIKVMCHTDVVAPIVTNRFPYFRRTSLFFDSKQSRLL